MKQLHDLKDRLCEELAAFSERDLNAANLEKIDTLAHATKNLAKIIEMKEEEYSGEMSNRGSYGGSYGDSSFARGRGRGAKRDSMGRYARDGYSRDTAAELREMSMFLPANKREEMERIIMQME